MARTFMHFAYSEELKKIENAKSGIVNVESVDEFTKLIEDTVQRMIDSGSDQGIFRVNLPEGISPEKAQEFMEEVMRQLNDRLGE